MEIQDLSCSRECVVIAVTGELDLLNAADARERLRDKIMRSGGNPIVDLSGLTFMDSAGAGALVFTHKQLLKEGRALRLAGVCGQPLTLVQLLRLDAALSVNEVAVQKG